LYPVDIEISEKAVPFPGLWV